MEATNKEKPYEIPHDQMIVTTHPPPVKIPNDDIVPNADIVTIYSRGIRIRGGRPLITAFGRN